MSELEPPPTRNLRALCRMQAHEMVGFVVQPAEIPAGLGCRPGDFLIDVDTETADRWIAAGLAEEHTGAIPGAVHARE